MAYGFGLAWWISGIVGLVMLYMIAGSYNFFGFIREWFTLRDPQGHECSKVKRVTYYPKAYVANDPDCDLVQASIQFRNGDMVQYYFTRLPFPGHAPAKPKRYVYAVKGGYSQSGRIHDEIVDGWLRLGWKIIKRYEEPL